MTFSVIIDRARVSQWGVIYFVKRKKVRQWFREEGDARERRDELELAFNAGGLDAVRRLDVDVDLEKAQELAAAMGTSVLELVKLGAAIVRGKGGGPTMREAFNGFEKRHSEINLRPKTVSFYSYQLEAMMLHLGETTRVGTLTRTRVRQWIDSKPLMSRPHALRASRAWFRWMLRQEPPLIEINPTAGMGVEVSKQARAITFLTVDEAQALLRECSAKVRPSIAMMLFAGIRHNELHREARVAGVDVVRWEDIDFARRTITVRGEVSKTRVARTVRKIPQNLWSWLRTGIDASGPVCPGNLWEAIKWARRRAGTPRWGKSILRHTCASHHVAAYGNLSGTALLIRHEGDVTLLNRKYREGVALSKADGKRFFGLLAA